MNLYLKSKTDAAKYIWSYFTISYIVNNAYSFYDLCVTPSQYPNLCSKHDILYSGLFTIVFFSKSSLK